LEEWELRIEWESLINLVNRIINRRNAERNREILLTGIKYIIQLISNTRWSHTHDQKQLRTFWTPNKYKSEEPEINNKENRPKRTLIFLHRFKAQQVFKINILKKVLLRNFVVNFNRKEEKKIWKEPSTRPRPPKWNLRLKRRKRKK
jgi:hypothetical protein